MLGRKQFAICIMAKSRIKLIFKLKKNEYLFIHDYHDNGKTPSAIFRGLGSGRLTSKLIDRSVYFEYD